ncbi:MAG: putative toxin-antitoxin system toxin component, PIN family [Nitrospirae bacterium]|nr:putative toxin-antitoxin system toxin component, PIN family [Nitrospirota bacterium]
MQVILDTNVLYAGLYSSTGASFQILKAADEGKIKLIISISLLFEYEDVLKRNAEILQLTDNEIDTILDNICSLSKFQKIYFLWRPYLKDSGDDHILEVAIASQTKTIITHNIKDFGGVEKFGVRAITPKQVLEEIT